MSDKKSIHLFALIFFCLSIVTVSHASLSIDSARTTSSTCANNGTISIYAHSSSTMLFAITGGSTTRPQQSGNSFASLAPGSYQILVTDIINDSSRTTVIVTGNYLPPTFSPTYRNPICPGSATGIIIGNHLNTGRRPFSWTLTNLSTSTSVTQASDSFNNLSQGSYSIKEVDSCGNFSTYSITLVTPNDSFNVISIINKVYPCDTVRMEVGLFAVYGDYAAPYTIKVQTRNGINQHPVSSLSYIGANVYITEVVPMVGYGDYINFTIIDACGRSVYRANTVASYNVVVNYTAVFDSCQFKYTASFALAADSSQTNVNTSFFPDPVTLVVRDVTTGAILGTVVTNDTINHSSQYTSAPKLPANQSYDITITDGCGRVYHHIYAYPNTPVRRVYNSIIAITCLDSTACLGLFWQNTFYTNPTLQLLSGPSVIGSTKPHYLYHDSIRYPQNFLCSVNSGGYFLELTNLAAGTYRYHVYDSCGNSITDSFVIRPIDLNIDRFSTSFNKGCPGQNRIYVGTDQFCYSTLVGPSIGPLNLTTPRDTLINLNSGTYIVTSTYTQGFFFRPVNAHPTCQVVKDTIIIPSYQPPQVSYSTLIKCHGSVVVIFVADSTTGLPGYKYEILSGPQSVPIQRSNTFTLSLPGAYIARVTDSCGSGSTYGFSVDTLSFPPIHAVGSSCIGNSVTLSGQTSPYITYVWQRPNGTSYTGTSVYINPIAATDLGTYNIKRIVNINGCRDTIAGTFNLLSIATTQIYRTICPGASTVFGGFARSAPGIYYDTIHTTGCDSIIALNLTIRGPLYDSVSQTICAGRSVSIGIHTYTTTGIYRDTISTSGCDSIHVLNLTVLPYKRSSISTVLCPGGTRLFGSRSLSMAGTYYDTIPTSGCDSIVTLSLSIRGPLYDSVSLSICAGRSMSAGTHTYTATGTYRDTIATSGCDSIHVLKLTVNPYKRSSHSSVICPGASLLFGTRSLSTAGTYYDTIPTSGCDSIVTLSLSIRGPLYDSVSLSICAGRSTSAGSHVYTTTGIYRDTIATSGCDSIHVLNLIIKPYKRSSISTVICPRGSLLFGSRLLSFAGTYYDTIPTSGCDSIVTLSLSIRGPLYDSISMFICPGQSVRAGTHTYATTGIYHDTISTGGCDSVHVLNLTLGSFSHDTISRTICQGTTTTFGSRALSLAGTYYDSISTTHCDSIVVLFLNIIPHPYDSIAVNVCLGQTVSSGIHTYSSTGLYYDTIPTGGCDSIHVLNLTVTDLSRDTIRQTICLGQSISIGIHTYSITGHYQDTLATAHCDSVISTFLRVISPIPDTLNIYYTCAGLYRSQLYSSDATLHDTLRSQQGCDSIYQTIQIHVSPPVVSRIDTSVCIYAGQSYVAGGHAQTTPGVYSDTIRTIVGACDSLIYNTHLRVITPRYISRRLDSCYTATIGGVTYSRDTVVIDTLRSVCGLDSLIATDTLHFYDPQIEITASLPLPTIAGQPVQLSISPADNYQNIVWSPNYEINNIYYPTPTVTPYVDTSYYVTAENSKHCIVTTHIFITVTGADLPDFLMPTAFTPNGDNLNDIFRPVFKPGASVDIIYFRIYDRWGEKIYDSSLSGTIGWDGMYKNVAQPMGVYVYFISAKVTSGKIVSQSGNLTLLH